MQNTIQIIPIHHIQEIRQGDSLVTIILNALKKQNLSLEIGDILIITQKIVSKAEGRVIKLDKVKPSLFAQQIAKEHKKDPRYIELILQESKRIVKMDHGVIISETHQGFICANAGVDASNIGMKDSAALLPKDPDESAKKIKGDLEKKTNTKLAVIISDTWGRPWREGQVNFTIGSRGLDTLTDYRTKKDPYGFEMKVSLIAIADELAAAAELVMGKTNQVPVAIIRGYAFTSSKDTAKSLLRDPKKDMFR